MALHRRPRLVALALALALSLLVGHTSGHECENLPADLDAACEAGIPWAGMLATIHSSRHTQSV